MYMNISFHGNQHISCLFSNCAWNMWGFHYLLKYVVGNVLPSLPTIQSHSKDNLVQVSKSRSDGLCQCVFLHVLPLK